MLDNWKMDPGFARDALIFAGILGAVWYVILNEEGLLTHTDTFEVEVCYKTAELDKYEGKKYGHILWAASVADQEEGTWLQDDGKNLSIDENGCFSTEVSDVVDGFGTDVTIGKAADNCWFEKRIEPYRLAIYKGDRGQAVSRVDSWDKHRHWFFGHFSVKKPEEKTPTFWSADSITIEPAPEERVLELKSEKTKLTDFDRNDPDIVWKEKQ